MKRPVVLLALACLTLIGLALIKVSQAARSLWTASFPEVASSDCVGVMALAESQEISGYELPDISPVPKLLEVYASDTLAIGKLIKRGEYRLPSLAKRTNLTPDPGNRRRFGTQPWPSGTAPARVYVNAKEVPDLCHVPMLNLRDTDYITSGGRIPAKSVRYYRVTAVTAFGESTPSNEVKFVARPSTDTNRFPLEITPVKGALSYRIYMTTRKKSANPKPWPSDKDLGEYHDGLPHLLLEIGHSDLIANECLIYDDGSLKPSALGYPLRHEGRLWTYNSAKGELTFANEPPLQAKVTALIPSQEQIIGVDFRNERKTAYLLTQKGLYEWDLLTMPETAVLVTNRPGYTSVLHTADGDRWLVDGSGTIYSSQAQQPFHSVPGGRFGTGITVKGIEYLATCSSSGKVTLIERKTKKKTVDVQLPFPDDRPYHITGVGAYGPVLLASNEENRSFMAFRFDSTDKPTYIDSTDWPSLNVTAWSLSGMRMGLLDSQESSLSVYEIEPDGVLLSRSIPSIDGSLERPRDMGAALPGEVIEPVWPQVIPNNNLAAGLSGYSIYKNGTGIAHSIVTEKSGVMMFEMTMPAAHNPDNWGFLRRSVDIAETGEYELRFRCESVGSAVGMNKDLVVTSYTNDGRTLAEYRYGFSYEPSGNQYSIPIRVEEEANRLELVWYISSYAEKTGAFRIWDIELIKVYRSAELDAFELMENKHFEEHSTVAPAGWIVRGPGMLGTRFQIFDLPGNERGNEWSIAMAPYDATTDNWMWVESKAYPCVEGDSVGFRLDARRGGGWSIYGRKVWFRLCFRDAKGIHISDSSATNTILSGYSTHSLSAIAPKGARSVCLQVDPRRPEGASSWTLSLKNVELEIEEPTTTGTFVQLPASVAQTQSSASTGMASANQSAVEPSVDSIELELLDSQVDDRGLRRLWVVGKLKGGHESSPMRYTQTGDVIFSITPIGNIVAARRPNSEGIASCIISVPNQSGIYTVAATHIDKLSGDEKKAALKVKVAKARAVGANLLPEPRTAALPVTKRFLLVSIEAPSRKKPLSNASDRIGTWQVFRPTIYNQYSMADFDVHCSPTNPLKGFEHPLGDPEWWLSDRYAKSVNIWYKDILSEYPSHPEFQELDIRHPEWFLRDHNSTDSFLDPFGDGRRHYDFSYRELREWFTRQHLNGTLASSWDGSYLDDFWGTDFNTLSEGLASRSNLNYKNKFEYQTSLSNFLRWEHDIFNRFGLYHLSNYPYGKSEALSVQMLEPHFDGYLRETWGHASDVMGKGYRSLKQTTIDIDTVAHWADKGKLGLFLSRFTRNDRAARFYTLVKFIMGKGEHSYFAHGAMNEANAGWGTWHAPIITPEMKLETGKPKGPYTRQGSLFVRDFERCIAILNGDATEKASYTLPKGVRWHTLWGKPQKETELTIPPHTGLIFLKGGIGLFPTF